MNRPPPLTARKNLDAKRLERKKQNAPPPKKFARIVNRKRYSVATATLIASDEYWDGHNFERGGRNTFLYRAPKGGYFTVTLSQWQGEQDCLTPISQDEAIALFEGQLTEHAVSYKEAFPDVNVEDA